MKKIIALFIMFLFFFIPINTFALSSNYEDKLSELLNVEKQDDKVNIYFFYSDTCPHCKNEEKFFEELEKRYEGKYVLHSYEVSSGDNSDLMIEAKKIMEDDQTVARPYTVIGDKSFVGYADEVGRKIETKLKEYLEIISEEESVVDMNKTSIPFLGEVNKKDVSIGLVAVILGFIDGFNPCAMWVLLFLINMLIGMNDKRKMLIIGFVFLFTSGLMYFLMMLGITNILAFISTKIIRTIIGIVAVCVGSYNIYKFFKERKEDDGCHVVDEKKRKKLFKKIKKFTTEKNIFIALLGVIVLAVSVNTIELACSSVFPATFAEILAVNDVDGFLKIIYLIVYTLFYMIDDIVVFVIAVATLQLSTASSKYGKYSKIIGGIIMLLVGLLLIFKIEWLMLNF